ncbi:5-methyltetrahydropteroyltriglutamate--homocysteine S-methyltransferase, partial [Campylobacter jejuni]|nr:5-methyltetrahydropteroyltriglutamate--homocysteine S-methyltransferase [Campylobacter jejuni]
QGENGDVTALAMKKWCNTNYHYLVPEGDNADIIALTGDKIFKEYLEAKDLGIESKPVLIGICTLFKLIAFKDEKTQKLAKEKLL